MTDAGFDSLFEEFMPEVEEIVKEITGDDEADEDLLQEGYIGLMNGVKLLRGDDPDLIPMNVGETIRDSIRAAVGRAVENASLVRQSDDRLIVQAELLMKSIDRLTEELGSKPNIDEIANDMEIPQDKVLEILKLMGENRPDDEAFYNT